MAKESVIIPLGNISGLRLAVDAEKGQTVVSFRVKLTTETIARLHNMSEKHYPMECALGTQEALTDVQLTFKNFGNDAPPATNGQRKGSDSSAKVLEATPEPNRAKQTATA